jgi:hypothetical protein
MLFGSMLPAVLSALSAKILRRFGNPKGGAGPELT